MVKMIFFSLPVQVRCFRDTGGEILTNIMDFFGLEFFICKMKGLNHSILKSKVLTPNAPF